MFKRLLQSTRARITIMIAVAAMAFVGIAAFPAVYAQCQCTYADQPYTVGACLNGQRCNNNQADTCIWQDDSKCPTKGEN
jgi:hypothetical protein